MNLRTLRRSDDEVIRDAIMSSGADEAELPDSKARSLSVTLLYVIAGIVICLAVWWIFAEVYNSFVARVITFPTPPECFARVFEMFAEGFSILGSDIEIPARLAEFMKGEKKSIQMTKDFDAFKNFLMNE